MNRNTAIPVVLLFVVFSGCSGANRSLNKGVIKDIWTQASDSNTIRVRGVGSAPDGIVNETQKRGLAREAALVNGRREALALLRGVKLTGGITIQKLMEKDSSVKELANAVILGMEEVQTEFTADSGCVVLLELKRDKLAKMLTDAGTADASEAYRQLGGEEQQPGMSFGLAKAKAQ